MITYAIDTRQYDIDLNGLLSRRLSQCGCVCGIFSAENGVTVTVQEGESVLRLAEALTMLLSRDLPYFELSDYTDALPLTLPEKQAVLTGALQQARAYEEPARVRDGLVAYLMEERSLNLEGYLRFRMQDELSRWRDGVEQAAAEQLLRREYSALLGSLNDFMAKSTPRSGDLALCLHPDGSCTVTDDSDARIEYEDCSEDGVLSLLIGMAPARLTIYDLSGGTAARLTDALKRVFAGRIRIYR